MTAALLRSVAVRVRDVSTGGCLLETNAHLPVGTVGVLDAAIDGERRLEWFRICRVQPTHGRNGAYLAAAEFLPFAAAGKTSIRGAIGRLQSSGAAQKISMITGGSSGDPGTSVDRLRRLRSAK
jgi:hypothetical protein